MTQWGVYRIRYTGALAALALGLLIGWWAGRPQPPWLDFTELAAFYKLGGLEITTDGKYYVLRECERSEVSRGTEPAGSDRVIWRYEAIATDGQIASYGPKPPAPSFSKGFHRYTGIIPLTQEINPDGWVVRVMITCAGEVPETVTSPAAKVQVRIRDPVTEGEASDGRP